MKTTRLVRVTAVVAIPHDEETVGDGKGGISYLKDAYYWLDYNMPMDDGSNTEFKVLEWDETELSLIEAPPLEAPKPTKKISK